MQMKEMTAAILVGGVSRRMGTNKSFLEHGEFTMLSRLIKECEEFQEVLLSVGESAPYEELGCRVVKDELIKYGPIEGIYQILRGAKTDYVFILATDMPEVSKAFMNEMVQALNGEICLVARTGDHTHPLCAIYHKDAIPVLERMRRENIHRAQLLIRELNANCYDVKNEKSVINVNTPEEYHAWKKDRQG